MNSNSNPSDAMDGIMMSGSSTPINFGIKDARFSEDAVAPGLMFNTNPGNSTTSNSFAPPKEAGIGSMLTNLHLEWKKHETERSRWTAEKAEYDAKIAILEGRLKSYANANNELLQRIKMLESALLVARSQEKFGSESILPESTAKIEAYQLPTSIYTSKQQSGNRGRHLLQQYLKEIQIIDDAVHSKSDNDSKIIEYLMKTSPENVTSENNTSTLYQTNLSSYTTDYSKTLDHRLNNKNKKPNIIPLSAGESSQFLSDLRKGYKLCANERKRDSTSNVYNNSITNNEGRLSELNNDANYNDESAAHHLFDMFSSFSAINNEEKSNPFINTNVDSNVANSNVDSNVNVNSNVDVNANSNVGVNLSNSVLSNVSSGGVVRYRDHAKKPNRMKLDMFNFSDDVISGTSMIPRKSESATPKIPNIFAQDNNETIESISVREMNAAFESRLDKLAKRFNITSSDLTSSSNDSLDNSSKSSIIIDNNNDVGGVDKNEVIIEAVVGKNDVSLDSNEDIDLGILNDIDSLISSQDDSINSMNASGNEIAAGDLTNAKSTLQKHWSINSVLRGHNDSITCVNLHPYEKMAVSASLDGLVCLWHYNDGHKCDMYPSSFLRGHEYPVLYCLFNNIGDCLYTSDSHGHILVWDVLNDDATLLCHYEAHEEAIWYMDHNHSSNTLLSASADGIVSLWKPDSTEPIETLTIPDSNGSTQIGVVSADFSPLDSSKIVVSAADTITLYDVNAHKNIFNLTLTDNLYTPTASSSSGLIQSSSIHPSMNIYATGWGHNQIQVVDLTSGEFVNSFIAHPAPITSLSFGNNCSGTYLATGGANGSIHMWNNNYTCYQDVPPHRVKHHTGVNSLCFHSTLQHMVTGGADELVKLYI